MALAMAPGGGTGRYTRGRVCSPPSPGFSNQEPRTKHQELRTKHQELRTTLHSFHHSSVDYGTPLGAPGAVPRPKDFLFFAPCTLRLTPRSSGFRLPASATKNQEPRTKNFPPLRPPLRPPASALPSALSAPLSTPQANKNQAPRTRNQEQNSPRFIIHNSSVDSGTPLGASGPMAPIVPIGLKRRRPASRLSYFRPPASPG